MLHPRTSRSAFTLTELLVVLLVISILLTLVLSAVQAARRSARRCLCANNLAQQIIAVHNYETFHQVFPPGTINSKGPILNRPTGYHHNWLVQLLPLMEQKIAYHHIDHQVSVYHKNNAPVHRMGFSFLHCPSDRRLDGYSNYAGVHHDVEAPIDLNNHGVFFLNSRVGRDDIMDGLSNTVFLGEKLREPGDLGWMSGTRATLRNTGEPIGTARDVFNQRRWTLPRLPPGLDADRADDLDFNPADQGARSAAKFVGGFASFHPGGANFAFGDGSIRLMPQNTSTRVLQQLGHRSDGQLMDLP